MRFIRPIVLFVIVTLSGLAWSAGGNPFFAMDTIAKGTPAEVVPLLKELGYDGLGGAAGDRAMAVALTQAGLRFFNGYVTLQFHSERPALDDKLRAQIDAMEGQNTTLWLALSKVHRNNQPLSPVDPVGDAIVVSRLKEIADHAESRGVKVALYPHTGHWFAHFEDAVRMADRLDRPSVGVTFNLCHWLKVEGSTRDPSPLLKAARPRLMFVTINGADTGDTRTMAWTRLIQPLGECSYDVAAFLRQVHAAGYTGPIGFQGYGIKAPPREVLTNTMAAWQRLRADMK